jgi:hypothetical protein
MTDITKCANYLKCPLAKECKRVLAEDNPHGWQSYSNFYIENKTECQHFIPFKQKKEEKCLN